MESSEIERELDELETRIERLRGLYEQYFMGIERIEPQIPRKEVDRRIWVLRREQIRNTGLRFKFQMLIQRYNTFQQYWARIAREIEQGTYRRDVVRAAQRVGAQEALTIVGRKRAAKYAVLVDQQQQRADARHPQAQAPAVDAGGVLQNEDRIDEATTPPRSRSSPKQGPPIAPRGAPPSSPGARVAAPGSRVAAPGSPVAAPGSPVAAPGSPVAAPAPPTATKPLGGLSWAGMPKAPRRPLQADAPPVAPPREPPQGAPPARSRVAALAEEMRAQRAQAGATKPAEPVAAPVAMPAVALPAPPVGPTPPPRPGAPATAPPAPTVGLPPPPRIGAPAVGPTTSPPTPPPVRPTPPPVRPTPPPARSTPPPVRPTASPPPAPGGRGEELPEQRLRQIYAKYVEAKRASNESTAGVTYERLADSLRSQAAKLRASNPARSVDYEVVVKNGKTLLKPILK